ncbi:hypothetical protein B296_00045314 [Ensete ventricosum]|uniref:CCT domain-containing protein n=1 Tax=Ensete ventricosum TaxID=4639 RepID=A0A426YUS6_ENSVE|nr:hypothetical protein B296_00045314 [Ensete ventricosum]
MCGACDARVHGTGVRHERVWMCEVCEQAPASVTCKADAAALCVTCDADIHSANPLALRHERAPIVPFLEPLRPRSAAAGFLFGVAAADEEASEAPSWLLPIPCANGKPMDHFFSDVDPYLDLEYATSIDARLQQADGVVPVDAKDTGRDGGAPPPGPFLPIDGAFELDFVGSKPSYSPYTADSLSHSFGVVPDGSGGVVKGARADATGPHSGGGGERAADREARVLRYREKRKNRRFVKTIRYASRKAYAETRPRIKGRFVKRSEIEPEEVDRTYSPAFVADPGYGVVPSF